MRKVKLEQLLAQINDELAGDELKPRDRAVLQDMRDELEQRIENEDHHDLNPLVERINVALAEAEAETQYPFLLFVSHTLTTLSNAGL